MDDERLREIIERCVKQDNAAQEELFKTFYGKMMAVSLRYIKDRDKSQVVVQESFIKIFDKLDKYDFSGSFEGWVKRIVTNTAIDTIRKEKKNVFSTDEDYLFDKRYHEQTHEFEEESITELKAEEAMAAIQGLSVAYRTVFNLYVIENYSHKEIAEILGISEGSSKSNLSKAKKKLRMILKEKFTKLGYEK